LSTSYILINSDLGTDEAIIEKIKEILDGENNIQYEIQGVNGVNDIILKLSSDDIKTLRSTITNKIRKITSVQSTQTMMVIEGQEKTLSGLKQNQITWTQIIHQFKTYLNKTQPTWFSTRIPLQKHLFLQRKYQTGKLPYFIMILINNIPVL